MRQAIMTSPGVIEFARVEPPQPGNGQVRVQVKRIGVCGSDIHVNKGLHPFTKYPVIQGHEWSGVIESLGPGVTDLTVGRKVTATPQIVCGTCRPCRRGDYNICDSLKVQGFQAPGCAQDLFVTDAQKIVLLPDDFTFEQGAFVEPAAVAVHSTARAGELADKNVAVIGAGPIGNLIAQLCISRGARVLLADVSDYRLEVARQCKIPLTTNARRETLAKASYRCFGSDGFDTAFECAGAQAALDTVVDSIQKGGTIVTVAVYEHHPTIDMSIIGDREIRLIGTLMYKYQDYVWAAELIRTSDIITDPMESKHFPFEQYAAAYRFIEEQGEKSMKVFIDL